jgi:hypothetical protein
MPLYWTADSKQRLFTGLGEGDVSFEDVVAFLEALAGAKAFSYRKLLDICAADSSMSCEELLALVAMIRDYHSQEAMGPLAMVATAEQTVKLARLLGALAAADRPFRVFENTQNARTWLDTEGRRVRPTRRVSSP